MYFHEILMSYAIDFAPLWVTLLDIPRVGRIFGGKSSPGCFSKEGSMSKLIRSGILALTIVMGLASTSLAGVLGTVTQTNDPAHDLHLSLNNLTLTNPVNAGTDFSFSFGNGSTFLLAGSYSATTHQVTTTNYFASGNENIGGAAVNYGGTISTLDISGFNNATGMGKFLFLISNNNGPSSVVWVSRVASTAGAADVSPVPLPSAASSGLFVLALLAGGAIVRRRATA